MRYKGPGDKQKKKATVKDTIVDATDSKGNIYKIAVKSNSNYARMARQFGSVPGNLRPTSVDESTDPFTAGISAEESKKRLEALNKPLKKIGLKRRRY